MKTLIIGLGNPLLGDDSVGWRVAEAVRQKLEAQAPAAWAAAIEVDCLAVGGLGLMERLVGYSQAILVDAWLTAQAPVGQVAAVRLESLPVPDAGHLSSAHDTSLPAALALGQTLGAALPKDIWVVGIEARQVSEFSETLTPAVAAAVPQAVAVVWQLLRAGE